MFCVAFDKKYIAVSQYHKSYLPKFWIYCILLLKEKGLLDSPPPKLGPQKPRAISRCLLSEFAPQHDTMVTNCVTSRSMSHLGSLAFL